MLRMLSVLDSTVLELLVVLNQTVLYPGLAPGQDAFLQNLHALPTWGCARVSTFIQCLKYVLIGDLQR